MNQDVQNSELDSETINVWELIEFLKNGWRWLSAGGVLGIGAAAGFLFFTPAQYEATAYIQPATVGVATVNVEPVSQMVERLKLLTFYADGVISACQADSAKELAQDVKASVVKGNNLLAITYRAKSPALAKTCLDKIVEKLAKSQEAIAAPLIKELENQQEQTKGQIESIERFLSLSDRQPASLDASNQAVLRLLRREELMSLRKQYGERRIQLTAPLTQPMQLLEPISAPDKAVYPKKLLTVIGGMVAGLFLGVFAMFACHSWQRFKSTHIV